MNIEHNLSLNDYLIKYYYNEEDLKCKKCGEIVKLRRGTPNTYCSYCFCRVNKKEGFKNCEVCNKEFEYKNSFEAKNKTCSKECTVELQSRKLTAYHKSLTKEQKTEIKRKMHETKLKNGAYDNIVAWNKGLTGIYSEETIEKIRNATLKQMEQNRVYKSSIESKMEEILISLNINFKQSFVLNRSQFDFLLIDYNIIIECDGDYWHRNLSIEKFRKNKNYIQINNEINDAYKTLLAYSNGYYLLRFWESEIMLATDDVSEKIKIIIAILGDNQHPSQDRNILEGSTTKANNLNS